MQLIVFRTEQQQACQANSMQIVIWIWQDHKLLLVHTSVFCGHLKGKHLFWVLRHQPKDAVFMLHLPAAYANQCRVAWRRVACTKRLSYTQLQLHLRPHHVTTSSTADTLVIRANEHTPSRLDERARCKKVGFLFNQMCPEKEEASSGRKCVKTSAAKCRKCLSKVAGRCGYFDFCAWNRLAAKHWLAFGCSRDRNRAAHMLN